MKILIASTPATGHLNPLLTIGRILIAPTLAALADEPDLLVIVTAGGRPIDTIPGPIPGNARLASYLPFEWMLPKVDVFVTNVVMAASTRL